MTRLHSFKKTISSLYGICSSKCDEYIFLKPLSGNGIPSLKSQHISGSPISTVVHPFIPFFGPDPSSSLISDFFDRAFHFHLEIKNLQFRKKAFNDFN